MGKIRNQRIWGASLTKTIAFPIETFIYKGSSIAVFDCQRVFHRYCSHFLRFPCNHLVKTLSKVKPSSFAMVIFQHKSKSKTYEKNR